MDVLAIARPLSGIGRGVCAMDHDHEVEVVDQLGTHRLSLLRALARERHGECTIVRPTAPFTGSWAIPTTTIR
jgi:hypothetical protein